MKNMKLLVVIMAMTLITACGNNAKDTASVEEQTTEATQEETETAETEETEETTTEEVEETKEVGDGEYKIYAAFVKTFELEDRVLTVETEDGKFEDFPIPEEMDISFSYPLVDGCEWNSTIGMQTEESETWTEETWFEWFAFHIEGVAYQLNDMQYYDGGEDFCKQNFVLTVVIKDKEVQSIGIGLEASEVETETEAETASETKPTETAKETTAPAATEAPKPVHQHSYTSSVTQNPSCVSNGVKTYVCSCGNSYTKAIPAVGHNWTTQYREVQHESKGEMRQV